MIGETVFQSIDSRLNFISILVLILIVLVGVSLAKLSRIARLLDEKGERERGKTNLRSLEEIKPD